MNRRGAIELTPLGIVALLLLAAAVGWGVFQWQARNNPRGPGPETSGSAITFAVSDAKAAWATEISQAFTAAQGGKYTVQATALHSRELMHKVLDGDLKPVVVGPDDTVWLKRLDEAWSKSHGGSLIDTNDPATTRVVLQSPLVYLTTRKNVPYLRSSLGGSNPWSALRRISMQSVPWRGHTGPLRWAHASASRSNSGAMTVGLILTEYAQTTGQSISNGVHSRGFAEFIAGVERRMMFDLPAQTGTAELIAAYEQSPSRYDFIVTYENLAVKAAAGDPSFAVIYPHPTVEAQHVVGLLEAPWITNVQREGARAFIQYLGTPEAAAVGTRHGFRPPSLRGADSPNAAPSNLSGYEDRPPVIDPPPYTSLNDAICVWRTRIAHEACQ